MHRFGGNLGQTAPWQLEMDGGVFVFSHRPCPSQLTTLASSLSLSIPLSGNGPIMLYGKCG